MQLGTACLIMGKPEIRKEALARQGQCLRFGQEVFQFLGDPSQVHFEEGGEGLVQKVVNEQGEMFCVKAFWEPTEERYNRSLVLAQQQLANPNKPFADALAGAPFAIIKDLGQQTPFAVVMKNVNGMSWRNLRERARGHEYPPPAWPSLEVRATWGYGLATAVLNMEKQQFIHADLSPGNIMLTPDGDIAGDMALVDFDGFVHPQWNVLDLLVAGSPGYAAPEISRGVEARVGSDRVALAILVQEFLLTGDPDFNYDEVFQWGYDQADEINSRRGEAHPGVCRKWPQIGALVEATLRAPEPSERPGPELWRHILFHLATYGVEPTPVVTVSAPLWRLQNAFPQQTPLHLELAAAQSQFNLAASPFQIHATLEQENSGALTLVVHTGAMLRAKAPGATTWQGYTGGARVPVSDGLTILDPRGACSAVFQQIAAK